MRAGKLGRSVFFLSSTLFDIAKYLKRYVGGLVQIDGSTLHIALLGLLSDDGVSASLFERTPVSNGN